LDCLVVKITKIQNSQSKVNKGKKKEILREDKKEKKG
jgi:hypothetical protein